MQRVESSSWAVAIHSERRDYVVAVAVHSERREYVVAVAIHAESRDYVVGSGYTCRE